MALALILAAWVWVVQRSRPAEIFGEIHDDALLLSSGKALAEGAGYVLPSIPGPGGVSPVQTKYPILFPLLLSAMWRWHPDFPKNLGAILSLVMTLGCMAQLVIYVFLRHTGLGRGTALGMTAYCGFNFLFLFYASRVLTDLLMTALMLGAAIVADRALEPERRWWWMPVAGLLTAAAILTRTVGVTVLLAVVGLAVYRRSYRSAAIFLVSCAPVVALGMCWPGNNGSLQNWVSQGGAGFQQTWAYYTSYSRFWRLAVPSWRAFSAMAFGNLLMTLVCPALYFLLMPLSSLWLILLHIGVSGLTVAGIVRNASRHGIRTIHIVLALQTLVIIFWAQTGDFTQRFFLPFLPLFCAGLWGEIKRLCTVTKGTFDSARPILEKTLAATGAVAVALLSLGAGHSYASHLRSFVQGPEAREIRAEQQRQELYAWLKAHTEPGARVLCWDDVKLYLYTGRKAIWPLAITPQMLYTGDRGVFERDRQHLLDTARHVGARYWVKAPNNFLYCAYHELYLQAEDEMLRSAPVIFQSSDGQLRLYDISCLITPSPAGGCGSTPGETKRAGI